MPFEFIEDPELRAKAEADLNTTVEKLKTELQSDFTKQIDGLKKNHDLLLDEKKKLQERFKGITNPEEAMKALKLVTENDEVRLLAEGKFDEVVAKRVSAALGEHEEVLKGLNDKLSNTEMNATKYRSMYQDTVRDIAIRQAGAAAKVQPSAMEDLLRRGRDMFTVGEDEVSVEARDKNGKLIKTEDDKVLTVALWIEGLKKIAPHLWPQSVSGDFVPGGGSADDLEEQIQNAARKGDSVLYRKLREKQKKMKAGE
jgi:hypothetical protein